MQYIMAEQGILEVEGAHVFVRKPDAYDHNRQAWKNAEEKARDYVCYLRDRITGKIYDLKRGTRDECHALKEAIGEFLSSDMRCVPMPLLESKAEIILERGLMIPLKEEDEDGEKS